LQKTGLLLLARKKVATGTTGEEKRSRPEANLRKGPEGLDKGFQMC